MNALLDLFSINTARRLLSLAGNERYGLIVLLFLGLAAAFFEALGLSFLIPLATSMTGGEISVDVPVIGPALRFIGEYVTLTTPLILVFVLGFFLVGTSIAYLNAVGMHMVGMRFAHGLRTRVFETALDRPVTDTETMPTGKFVNNLVKETWNSTDALFVLIMMVVEAVAALVLLTFLLLISPFYTGVLVLLTGGMSLIITFTTKRVRALGAQTVRANEAFMAHLWDVSGGLRVVRAFGREPYERMRFAEKSRAIRRIFVRLGALQSLVQPLGRIMIVATVTAIVAIAVTTDGPVTDLVGFLAIAYRLQPRMSNLLNSLNKLRQADGSIAEVERALRRPAAVAVETVPFAGVRQGITFKNVSARYPNAEKTAVVDITCEMARGQVTAVCGYSGAGKSTLVSLLLRFLQPEHGHVLIDDVPLQNIAPEDWHRQIALVEQSTFIFNMTVRDNIGYGDLDASEKAIEEAARLAHAEEFILGLPKGYDTIIGDNGVRLSQGQRQRIALARALLRRPDVLILDEATNALDRPTELALRDTVSAGQRDRVVIVIAHRRETIETADHVIVIDKGRVVQSGTPAELASRPGIFATLYHDEMGGEARAPARLDEALAEPTER